MSEHFALPIRFVGKTSRYSTFERSVSAAASSENAPVVSLSCDSTWSITRLKLEILTLLHGKTPAAQSSSCILHLAGEQVKNFQTVGDLRGPVLSGAVVDCLVEE